MGRTGCATKEPDRPGGPNVLDLGSVEYVVPSDVPCEFGAFVPITTGSTYMENTTCGTGQQFAKGPRWPISHHSMEPGVAFGSGCGRRAVRTMSTEPQRTCSCSGDEFSGAMEFCPVCMLRKALADGVESGESSASEKAVKPTLEQVVQRFEHYELAKREDGKPVELAVRWGSPTRHLSRSALPGDT
jgi:hypothetical protein